MCGTSLQPLDLEVGKWLCRHAPGIKPLVVMSKSEALHDGTGFLAGAAAKALMLGFGDPIVISAETVLGMIKL